jgi:hypothetical protein
VKRIETKKKFKFQLYLQHVRKVLWMQRKQWESVKPLFGKPIKVDVTKTPMSNIAKDALILANVAVRSSDQTAMIDIYRYDAKDQPTPVNKDSYIVMEDILGRPDYQELVIKSSTSDSPELREFLRDNVGLVKAEPSTNHWLTKLPSSIVCIIRQSNNSRL